MLITALGTAGGGFMLAASSALALLLLGLVVVKRHPAAYDPARKAKRFTLPAGALVILTALGCALFAVGLIAAGILALTT